MIISYRIKTNTYMVAVMIAEDEIDSDREHSFTPTLKLIDFGLARYQEPGFRKNIHDVGWVFTSRLFTILLLDHRLINNAEHDGSHRYTSNNPSTVGSPAYRCMGGPENRDCSHTNHPIPARGRSRVINYRLRYYEHQC